MILELQTKSNGTRSQPNLYLSWYDIYSLSMNLESTFDPKPDPVDIIIKLEAEELQLNVKFHKYNQIQRNPKASQFVTFE